MGKKYLDLRKGKRKESKVIRVRKKSSLVKMGEYLRNRI